MPIRLVQPPPATTASLCEWTADAVAMSAGRAYLSVPHPVFHLSMRDLELPGDVFARAAMAGWRYLLTEGTRVVAAVEGSARWRGGRPATSNTSRGRFVQSTARMLDECDRWPELRSRDAVLALLRVPSLYFVALWLRDARGRGTRDLFVPLDPAPPGITAGQRLGSAQTVAALRLLAQRRQPSTGDSN